MKETTTRIKERKGKRLTHEIEDEWNVSNLVWKIHESNCRITCKWVGF